MSITREQLDKGHIDFKSITTGKRLRPVHPGQILKKDFLRPRKLTAYALAKALGITPIRISEILHGVRGITADTALLLARFFGTSPDMWMGLQSQYDLEQAANIRTTKNRLLRIDPYETALAGH